jgi:hydrogenase 3 maturation protease
LLTGEVTEALTPKSGEKLLIITTGNELRGDDGAGPCIAENLSPRGKGFFLLHAGANPESIIDDAIAFAPSRVLFIDAAHFDGAPGETGLFDLEHLPVTTLSTHTFPLSWLASLLINDTGCTVSFLGIQARSFELGAPLSAEVQAAVEEIVACLSQEPGFFP